MLTPSLRTRFWLLGTTLISLIALPAIADDTADDQTTNVAPLVTAALRAELDGDNATRRQLLSQAPLTDPDNLLARSQSGAVKVDDASWVEFQDVAFTPNGLLAEYLELRSHTSTNVSGLWELADWCREQGLKDQERAHLTQVIELDPDQATARERLGDINLNGLWVSTDDIERAATRQAEISNSLERWGSTIEDSLRLLEGVRRQRDRGHEQLFGIRDISAIPAMERILSTSSEAGGLLLIEWLSRLNAFEASQAMARTALVSPHTGVRRTAAESLQTRSFDEFMPVLLGSLKTPVTARSKSYVNQQGWVVLDMVFNAEAQNERRELHFSTEVGTQVVIKLAGGRKGPDLGDRLAVQRYLANRERQGENARLQWNEFIHQTNSRSQIVLRTVTEVNEQKGPEEWWKWWDNKNEVYFTSGRPLLRVQPDPERVYIQSLDKQITSRRPRAQREGGHFAEGSCLVAGTPVWTEQGPIPVEVVQIGDRVLAQDVDSGELVYQPVLKTTVRPPIGTFQIATDSIELRATGGHPFWVNGEGWRFAHDLEPGMCLHGTDGAQPITSVEPAEEAEAFNLVVADFHTYFIGTGHILSHDNTPRDPTNALVPGLLREP